MKQKNNKTKVLIALSGGVDSSVSAALLVRAGYDVTAAFMKQWSDGEDALGICTWKQDRRDALRVAARLGISLITLDFEKEYKEWVASYMYAEYEKGRTPNPDVMCNKYIKFGVWLEWALAHGYDYLATGHYARLEREIRKNYQLPITNYQFKLLEAKDKNKDQTYFLNQLSQKQLAHVMFPIGVYTKPEVRKLAKKFDLPTAEREESMGICFIGEMPMKEFLQKKIKINPGKIVFSSGEVVGEHEGLPFYTIGQRHIGGIPNFQFLISNQISNSNVKKTMHEDTRPLYVVDKRFDVNELVVGFDTDPLLNKKEIAVIDVHWVAGKMPDLKTSFDVRLRHRQKFQKAKLKIITNEEILMTFKKAERAPTPGQFAVFYKDGVCLGGGVIK